MTQTRRAFTIVELIVVIAIIALVLGIGLPAFNAMSNSAKLSKARQLVNGTLTRAHAIALSDRNFTAVRFMPAEWELDDSDRTASGTTNRGAQALATYRYVTTSRDDSGLNGTSVLDVRYSERFERIKGGPSAILPADVWAAPAEALDTKTRPMMRNGDNSQSASQRVLSGTLGTTGFDVNADGLLELNPGAPNAGFTTRPETFLDADDFLIVFTPEGGIVESTRRTPWRLLGYDPRPNSAQLPTGQRETPGEYAGSPPGHYLSNPYQRFAYTGVALYGREQFVALGATASAQDRYGYLARPGIAKKLFVNRAGGGLIEGN